jgi:L-fuconate dehydratase
VSYIPELDMSIADPPQHFVYPCSINSDGHYNVPLDSKEGYSIEMKDASIAEFEFPHGSYWASAQKK